MKNESGEGSKGNSYKHPISFAEWRVYAPVPVNDLPKMRRGAWTRSGTKSSKKVDGTIYGTEMKCSEIFERVEPKELKTPKPDGYRTLNMDGESTDIKPSYMENNPCKEVYLGRYDAFSLSPSSSGLSEIPVAEWSASIQPGNMIGIGPEGLDYNHDAHGSQEEYPSRTMAVKNHEGLIEEREAKVWVKFHQGMDMSPEEHADPTHPLESKFSDVEIETPEEVDLSVEELEYLREILSSILECSTHSDNGIVELPEEEVEMIQGLIWKLT